MFAEFNYELFPIVIVNFSENIENNDDFKDFLNKWTHLYNQKKDFIFIFNTTNVGFPSIKYCFMMTIFIKNLRKNKYHYLKKSIIIVKNKNVMNLLDIIFYLQPPVAEVYLTKNNIEEIVNNIDNIENLDILKKIKPGPSILPFL